MGYDLMYQEMINELRSINQVHITTNDFYLKEELLPNFIENHLYFKNLKEELHVLNDNSFSWGVNKEDNTEMPIGEFHFHAVEEVVNETNKRILSYEVGNKSEKGSFFPFDDHPESGDGIMGCLKFRNTDTEVWLYNENGELFPMTLRLPEYILKTFEFKALFGWQYFFIEVDWNLPVFSVVRSDLIKRIEILNNLFPVNSYAEYLKKIK